MVWKSRYRTFLGVSSRTEPFSDCDMRRILEFRLEPRVRSLEFRLEARVNFFLFCPKSLFSAPGKGLYFLICTRNR